MLISATKSEYRSVGMCSAVTVEQAAQISAQDATASPGHIGDALLYTHAYQLPGETYTGEGKFVKSLWLMLCYPGSMRDVTESLRQGQQLRQQDLFMFRDKEAYCPLLVDPAVRRDTSQPFA